MIGVAHSRKQGALGLVLDVADGERPDANRAAGRSCDRVATVMRIETSNS